MTSLGALRHLGHALIRASAGTGKTHALCARYAQWVADGLEPQNIVAITFTRKAAAELRSRIRQALIAQGAGAAAIYQLARAPITNFHGLCLSLCEEFLSHLDVGHDGRIQLLGGAGEDKQLFLSACESAWFAGSEDLRAALATVNAAMPVNRALMAQLWHVICLAREDAQPIVETLFGQYHPHAIARAAHEQLQQLREQILLHEAELDTPAGLKAIAHLRQCPVPVCPTAQTEDEAWQHAWHAMFAPINRKGRIGLIVTAEQMQSVQPLIASIVAERLAEKVSPALCQLTQAAYASYNAAKAAQHCVDFADLIEHAIELLARHPHIYRVVRQRTLGVLVDEAQDTNALQRRLVRLLVGLDGPSDARLNDDMPSVAITAVVGDWKQAIYTFRGADPQNFARFAKDVSEMGGQEESLAQSFRSQAPLVHGINALGEHLFGEAYEPLQPPAHQPAQHGSLMAQDGPPWLQSGMQWLSITRSDKGRLTLDDEAWATAHHAKAMIEAGVQPRDIAILLPNVRGPAPAYLQAFANAGVPLVACGTSDLLAQQQIVEILSLCAWLDSADEASELDGAIALSSSLFCLDDDDLYFLWGPEGRASGRVAALRRGDSAALASTQLHPLSMAVRRCCDLMPDLMRAARCLPMAELLEALEERLHLRAVMGAHHALGAQCLADFDALVSLVENLTRKGIAEVADCISALKWRKSQGLATAQGDSATAGQQAVMLSSVHSSKGLQYPIVLLPTLERKGQNSNAPLLFARDFGLTFAVREGQKMLRPMRHKRSLEQLAETQKAELKRLVYVAITRAQRQVVFIAPPPEECRNTGFAGLVAPWAQAADKAMMHSTLVVPPSALQIAHHDPSFWQPDNISAAAAAGAEQDAARQAVQRLGTPHMPQSGAALPSVKLLTVSSLLNAYNGDDSQLGLSTSISLPQGEQATGALNDQSDREQGILAHAILARLDDAASFADLAAFVDAELRFFGHCPEDDFCRSVAAAIVASLQSPLGRALLSAPPKLRQFEVAFTVRRQLGGCEVILSGQADAVLRIDRGMRIIDFKYAKYRGSAHKRYEQQLQVYAWALRQLWGEKGPEDASILYLKEPQAAHQVPVDNASCQWVEDALAQCLQQQR